jgi:glycine/D-amino acid oxidase-like deaminating enzyme
VTAPAGANLSDLRENHLHYDVVVIGGGAIGASVAYFLRNHPKACSVAVIERDKAYQHASTPRASGGVRRLFALPENIALSNFSIPFFERFEADMSVNDEPAQIDFKKNGYLFIVSPTDIDMLERNYRVQQEHGVKVVWLDRNELKSKFPSMNVTDLAAAVYSPDDGWLDPYSVLRGLRRKAVSIGATFLDDEVVGLETQGERVRNVTLKSGAIISADHVVNAAGAWAKQISAMVGMRVPIEPMRRYEHYFESEQAIEPLPYLKDSQRLAFRPEGKGYSGGVPDIREPRGFNFEIEHDYFERVVWPALAHRFPAFERTKEKNVMAGLYDQNELDGNVIIGPWTGGLRNFYLVAGFSGHGLMHAPGCGRAIAELILDGSYQTIDLGRFGWQRVLDGVPYRETGII